MTHQQNWCGQEEIEVNDPLALEATASFQIPSVQPDHYVRPKNAFNPFTNTAIEQSIVTRFEQQVKQYATHVAVKDSYMTFTYEALNQNANRVAHALMKRRRLEEAVVLLLDQDAALLVAILGILKAGKIYVPLDYWHPEDRIKYMVTDAQASAILTNSRHLALAERLAGSGCDVLNIDELDMNLCSENHNLLLSPDTLAYIYYTSGSTGQPKGVVDTHRNVLHNIMRYTNTLHICPNDRLSLLQSASFSGAVSNIFGALLNGASVFPFDLHEQGMGSLGAWLRQEEITIYHSVPMIFRNFLNGTERFPNLRVVRLEGDQAAPIDVELYKKYLGSDCILVNGLGATETGITRQLFINKQTLLTQNVVPVGYAVEDMEILLLGDDNIVVGSNDVGEITVKSRYLASGYWRRPDLTSAAFLPSSEGDVRMYRTGDLGRMLPDGALIHLGRKNFQSKIRGHTIDFAEVEAALLQIGTLKEVVVVIREDRPGDQRLVAYLVPDDKLALSVSMMRQLLAETVPDYMIPSIFILLEALPLSPNNKLDRRALPAPNGTRPNLQEAFVAARTSEEELLVDIWTAVLNVEQVGVHDNFFDLGGHSLLVAQVINQVRDLFQVELPLKVFFNKPTIAGVAEQIETIRWITESLKAPLNSAPPDYEKGTL
jgi:amino acid adenylation domain-containing protein